DSAATVTVTGTAAAGEIWRLIIEHDGSIYAVDVAPSDGDDASTIAGLFVAATAPAGFTLGASGSDGVTVTNAAGDAFTFSVKRRQEVAYTIVGGETTSEVTASLASFINADPNLADYSARAEGRVLVIVNRVGTPLAGLIEFEVDADGDGSDAAPATDARFAATGVALAVQAAPVPGTDPLPVGQTYTVVLIVGNVTSQHAYLTTSGDTRADVALALAADINTNGGEDFTALSEGGTLLVVNRAGQAFSMSNVAENPAAATVAVAELLATTVFAGEVWTIRLDDGTFTTTHAHVVAQGETLADVARELADNINASGTVTFVAVAEGESVVIVNLADQAFTTMVEVTPVGSISVIELREFNEPLPGNEYFYRPVNLNTRVDEADQVDTLNIFHGNSPADDVGVLTGDHLTGLGMGGDTVIAGRVLPGGITYRDLEVLSIELGTGNDSFYILSTHAGATNIASGRGDDTLYVDQISGHTTIDAEQGADHVYVASEAAANLLGLLDSTVVVVDGPQVAVAGSATVAVSGSAGVGERWHLVIEHDGSTYVTEIAPTAGDDADAIAALFAAATAPTGFSFTALGALVTVANGSEDFSVSVERLDPANVVDSIQALLTVIGGDDDDEDTLYIDESGETDHNVAVLTGSTLTGLDMPSISEIQTIFVQAAAGVYKLRVPDAKIDAQTASTTVVELSGTPLVGDVWTISIDGEDYEATVGTPVGLDSVAKIAAAIALQIDATERFTAFADGNRVVIVSATGQAFDTVFQVLSQAAIPDPSADFEALEGATTVLLLTGTPIENDVWHFEVNGSSFDYTIAAGTTLADVAEDLATDIAGLANLVAAAAGSTVMVVDRSLTPSEPVVTLEIRLGGPAGPAGGALVVSEGAAQSFAVNLRGTPVPDETWLVLVDVDSDPDTDPVRVPYTVASGDTLADVASGLAAALNAATSLADYTATAEGVVLIVVNRSGAEFALALRAEAAITASVDDTSVPGSATITLSGTPVLGERFVLRIQLGSAVTFVAYTVVKVDADGDPATPKTPPTLTDIARGLALVVAAATGDPVASQFDASFSGDSLTLVYDGPALPAPDLTVSVTIAPVGAPSATLRAATTAEVAISGTPVTGDAWVVQIVGSGGTTTHSYTVDLPARIAELLAQQINAIPYAAAGSLAGGIVEGETWTVRFTSLGVTRAFSYEVAALDDHAAIATGLAAAINASDDYVASAAAGDLLLSRTDGAIFTVAFSIAPVAETLDDIAAAVAAGIDGFDGYSASVTGAGVTITHATRTFSVVAGNGGGSFVFSGASAPVASLNSLTVELSGTLAEGRNWRLLLSDATGEEAFAFTQAASRVPAIGAVYSGYTATSDGAQLVIGNLRQPGFTVTPGATGTYTVGGDGGLEPYQTDVVFGGEPTDGETWSLTLNDPVNGDTVVSFNVDRLADLIGWLVADINANGPATVTAGLEGTTLLVTDRTGAAFDVRTWIALDTATEGTVSGPTEGDAVIVTLDGTPVVGDLWRLTVNSANYDFTIIDADVTLEQIAAALADAVDGVTDTNVALRATAAGAGIFIVDTDPAGTGVTASFRLLLQGGPAFAATATTAAANVVAVTLSGTPQDGETWGVSFDSITSDVPVADGGIDTLDEIAAALAVDINGQTGDYQAIADGANLLIVKVSGAFTATLTTTVVGPDVSGAVDSTPTAVVLSLAGTPIPASVWTVELDGESPVAVTVGNAYTIGGVALDANTLEDIARILADMINTTIGGEYVATAEAAQIVVIKTTGGFDSANVTTTVFDGATPLDITSGDIDTASVTTAVAYQLGLAGAPVLSGDDSLGETWTLNWDGESKSLTLNAATAAAIDTDGVAGVSLAEVAAALADAINADLALSGYVAFGEGDSLVLIRTGGAFTTPPAIDVVPYNAVTSSAGAATATRSTLTGAHDLLGETWRVTLRNGAQVLLGGTAVLGQTWTLTLNDGSDHVYDIAIGDTVNSVVVDSIDRLATAFAYEINSDVTVGFAVVASGKSLTLKNVGPVFGAIGVPGAAGTLAVSDLTQTFSYTAVKVDADGDPLTPLSEPTLADIANGLAGVINAQASSNFSAIGEGDDLVIFNQAGVGFATTVKVTPAGGFAFGAPSTPITLDLVGPTVDGDSWMLVLTLDGVSREYAVGPLSSDSLSDVATDFATAINDESAVANRAAQLAELAQAINAGGVYTATVSGGTTLMISKAGQTVSATATAVDLSTYGNTGAAGAGSVALDLSAATDGVWTIGISSGGAVSTYAIPLYTATTGTRTEGLETIQTLEITSAADRAFTVSYALSRPTIDNDLSTPVTASEVALFRGTPVAGEVWTVDALGAGDAAYTAQQNDTLADVVAALAREITDNVTDFVATGRGGTLVITSTSGFTASYDIVAVNGGTANGPIATTTAQILGTALAGENWAVSIGGKAYEIFAHTVRESVPVAEVAADLAGQIDAAAGYRAWVEGDTLVIEKDDGAAFATLVTLSPLAGGSYSVTVLPSNTTRVTLEGTASFGQLWTVNVGG
ncbi:MAG: hypothetical protein AMS20_10425, partial [Gemmatimonas sp. SG8_28]